MEMDRRDTATRSELPTAATPFDRALADLGLRGQIEVEEWAVRNGPSHLLCRGEWPLAQLLPLLEQRLETVTGNPWRSERNDATEPGYKVGSWTFGEHILMHRVQFQEQGGEGRAFLLNCKPGSASQKNVFHGVFVSGPGLFPGPDVREQGGAYMGAGELAQLVLDVLKGER